MISSFLYGNFTVLIKTLIDVNNSKIKMSADHQVRSLLDVISFILERLSTSDAQSFDTDIFSGYFRKHCDLVDERKESNLLEDSSLLNRLLISDKLPSKWKNETVSDPKDQHEKYDYLSRPLIITENSLKSSFFGQNDESEVDNDTFSLSLLQNTEDECIEQPKNKKKIIIFDPYTSSNDLDEECYKHNKTDNNVFESEDAASNAEYGNDNENEKKNISTVNENVPGEENYNNKSEVEVENSTEHITNDEIRLEEEIKNERIIMHKNKLLDRRNNYTHEKSIPRNFAITLDHLKKKLVHQCSICEEQFRLKRGLLLHLKEMHQMFLCIHDHRCKFIAGKKEDIDEHIIAVHDIINTKESFPCPYCEVLGLGVNALENHIRKYHYPNLDGKTCPICFCKLKSDNCSVSYHIENSHSKIEPMCKICEKTFTGFKTLKIHLNEIHTGKTGVACEICGKKILSSHSMKKHMAIHMATGKNFPCDHCDKRYSTRAQLNGHVHSMHKGDYILCTHCEYKTRDQSTFKRHMVKHSDERPYCCEKCGLKFKCKETLKSHESVHTDEKKHKCNVCGKQFRRLLNLRIHERIHQGRHEAYCNLCDKNFVQMYNYKTHVIKHHLNELENLQDDPHLKEEQLK